MTAPALAITNLRFRYAADQPWIIDVPRLEVPRGEQLLLTGGSGCGKSTLLHLIAGLINPSRGEILVSGESIPRARGHRRDLIRGRNIGMIFQTFNLLHGFSAEENVMAALMFADSKRFPPKAHRARAEQLLRHLGIDHPLADPDRLSVGQQQRVAVARAVACEPALVLADEPTASLDPENGAVAMDLIQRTCREIGAALLCVSHDPTMAARFEHGVTMDRLKEMQPA